MMGAITLAGAILLAATGMVAAGDCDGRVIDAQTRRPVIGANCVIVGTRFGAYADDDGRFHFADLPAGTYDLIVSHVGYRSRRLTSVSVPEQGTVPLGIELTPDPLVLADVVVSATRTPQQAARTPVSMSTLEQEELASYNALSISGPIDHLPGVVKVGSQMNIRGSSGYSRGTGSRVLMLMDGFPMLSADNGDIKWDAVPVDEVERIEVIKGAGSALYGTGALGGVVNVITRRPRERQSTRFRAISGLHSQPAHGSWRWRDQPMYLAGIDVSHNRRARGTDVLVSTGVQTGTGYQENGDFRRFHLFAKAERRVSPRVHWTGLTTYAVDDHGVFLQWQDRTEPLRVPEADRSASTVSWKLGLASQLSYMPDADTGIELRNSYYHTEFDNSEAAGGLGSVGHKIGTDLRVDRAVTEHADLKIGTSAIVDVVQSPGDFLGQRRVANLALYGQFTYEPSETAGILLGLRYDAHRRNDGEVGTASAQCGALATQAAGGDHREYQLSPQLGVSLRPLPATWLRASVSRGFRAPSVTEVHVQADASGVLVCPSPDLRSERSRSWEVGVRQRIGALASLDAALFWSTYDGLIEARPEPLEDSAVARARFRNISQARVRGVEVEQRAQLPWALQLRFAYTYLDAVEDLEEGVPLPPFCQDGLVPGEEAPLPFRPRHAASAGLSSFLGAYRGGIDFRYLSRFERVSGLFAECGRDHIPVYLVDVFASRPLGEMQLTLRVDNLLQYHYVLTERKIRSSRTMTLSVSGEL